MKISKNCLPSKVWAFSLRFRLLVLLWDSSPIWRHRHQKRNL